MTRHPTTQDLRRALAAICATPEQRAKVDEAFGAKRGRIREERETEPRVPIIGLDAGATPGTKPQPGCSGAYLERVARDTQQRVSSTGVKRPK